MIKLLFAPIILALFLFVLYKIFDIADNKTKKTYLKWSAISVSFLRFVF
jgi:hypothetical protein